MEPYTLVRTSHSEKKQLGITMLCSADAASAEIVPLLAIRLSETGGLIARLAIQLPGGMGMMEELVAIRLATRILMAEFEFGDADARRILRLRKDAAGSRADA